MAETTNQTKKLKDCPFCGGRARLVIDPRESGDTTHVHKIVCDCGASVADAISYYQPDYEQDVEKLKARWNTRKMDADISVLQSNADNAFQEGLNENRALFAREVISEFTESITLKICYLVQDATLRGCIIEKIKKTANKLIEREEACNNG